MDEDFNNADVTDLPDLTSENPTGAASTDTETASPEPQSTDGEPITPIEGQESENPEGSTPEDQADGEPSTEDEGTQATVGESASEEEGKSKTEETQAQTNNDFLSEMSEGRIKDADDFEGLLSHYDELKQITETPEMLLPEGKARDAFKYAMQFNGNAASANQSFHHVMSLNPESLSPKELQFEAYMLKEENADLLNDPIKARRYFEAEYKDVYGEDVNLEELKVDDLTSFRKHEIATAKATKEITELQAKFQSETPVDNNEPVFSPEEREAYDRLMDETLDNYGGLKINFSDDDEGMNFILDNQQIQQFQTYAREPGKWMESVVDNFVDPKTDVFDSNGYADFMARAMYAEQLIDLAFQQGQTYLKIKNEDELRNAGGEQAGGAPPIEQPKTELDALGDALELDRQVK